MKNYLLVFFLLLGICKIYSQPSYSNFSENNKFIGSSLNFSNQNFSDTLSMDKNSYFLIGIPSLSYKISEKFELEEFSQTGIMIGSRKNSTNIEEISYDNNIQLFVNLGTENTIGFFVSQFINKHPDNVIDTAQHYSGILNLFSYNINTELIITLPVVNRKIIGGASLTFLNLGATGTYFRGGRFDGKFIGALDYAPLYLQLYGKFSFKNATFGIGVFLNPMSLSEYRFGEKELLEEGTGIFMNSAKFKKYALSFYVHFRWSNNIGTEYLICAEYYNSKELRIFNLTFE